MLARVHGQCGCATITRVWPFGASSTFDMAGQLEGVEPTRPGELSYLKRVRAPNEIAAIHAIAKNAVTKMAFGRVCKRGLGIGHFYQAAPVPLADASRRGSDSSGTPKSGAFNVLLDRQSAVGVAEKFALPES